MRRRWSSCLALALASTLIPAASGHGAERRVPQLTRTTVKTDRARVDRHFRFSLRVACESSVTLNCEGSAYVTTVEPILFGFPFILTSGKRKYELGKGRERLMTFHLQAGHHALRKRGRLWVRTFIQTAGESAEKPVLLRWRPESPRR